MSDPSRAIVRLEHVLASANFIGVEETRFYLQGVFIQPHPAAGATLAATDGKALSVILDPDAHVEGEPMIWAPVLTEIAGHYRQFLKDNRRKDDANLNIYLDMTADRSNRGVCLTRLVAAQNLDEVGRGLGVELCAQRGIPGRINWIDGNFPSFDKVIPAKIENDPTKPVWIDTKYIAKITKFAKYLALASNVSGDVCPITLVPNGDGPGIALFAQENAFVVFMPIRGRQAAAEAPIWARTTPASVAATKAALAKAAAAPKEPVVLKRPLRKAA